MPLLWILQLLLRPNSRLSFPPIHLQPIYREKFGFKKGDFPISEEIFNTFLDIPCWKGMGINNINLIVNHDFPKDYMEQIIESLDEASRNNHNIVKFVKKNNLPIDYDSSVLKKIKF